MHRQHPQTAYRRDAILIGTIFEHCDRSRVLGCGGYPEHGTEVRLLGIPKFLGTAHEATATGCGSQHPLRALSSTRVLLAAAPTTPPCFSRRPRSSSLHRADCFPYRWRVRVVLFKSSYPHGTGVLPVDIPRRIQPRASQSPTGALAASLRAAALSSPLIRTERESSC